MYVWPVSGLIFSTPPLTAFTWASVIRARPGKTNLPGPFLPSWLLTVSTISSMTLSTCFLVNSVFSAMWATNWDFVIAFTFAAALAMSGHSDRGERGGHELEEN